jgi:NAD(P)H-dependent FMN reductase
MPDAPILIVSGTNRPGANALKIANIVRGHYASAGVPVELYSLAEMPREIFDPSSYATKRVVESAGMHVVTPEYNGSFPGVLKYFIDMLKFPESFEGKPVAFTGEAAGIWGAFRAVEQLQLIFGYRNAYVYPERVFIPGINKKLDASGKLTDASIDERLTKQAQWFAEFARRFG